MAGYEFGGTILPVKEREKTKDRWLKERLETILPAIMDKHQLDVWVIVGREYHEDPIVETLFPAAVDSSRRLTLFAFFLNEDKTVNRYVIHTNPAFDPFYERVWKQADEDQWECLARLIDEKNPRQIGVNMSQHYSFCDGLSHTFYEKLREVVGQEYATRVVSAEKVALDWLEIRSPEELAAYPAVAETARGLAQEALSNKVIHPGITTTTDVVDWIRQRVNDLGVQTSFYPTVDVVRKGGDRLEGVVILPGDVVHIDFGIHYLGLATDTQQLAYVLHAGEEEAPEGLLAAMRTAIRMEEIIAENFVEGRTGNDIFQKSVKQANQEGIQAMIYSHPLGNHCHAAGPLIGMYDKQQEIPIRGELALQNNTCYAMEFNIRQYIPEWDQEIPVYLEEPISFIANKVQYLAKSQMEYYLIR
ncbi:hypothetical protein AN963_02490 [Brevibacillus choshinensis]|uniref:Peptidase M24 domain-containing protein n=1 Tax=Brevibacillus choshinensis TaxID=54911 RepID=A0ABR5NAW5_BRECH|nr:M24 family metallopeptidase [Brevibacillus choshinensis]KQL48694.1 hypothetical protein AN963_02490 [Brevibacillus choshinensis]